MANESMNGWEHRERNKPVDPRVQPGISVPGVAAAAAPATVAPVTSPNVVAASPAAAAASPVTPVAKPTLAERIKAALDKGEAEVEKILSGE